MKANKILFGVVILALSIMAIYYVYNLPCVVAPMTQTVQGQVITINEPSQINTLLCLSSDPLHIVLSTLGLAGIFSGFGLLVSGLTEKK